ncbi:MAG TPA: alpha amylase N-terminal ig-like domain-containing protein, partial [Bacillota bacterium]|nr:alpha amylase N-terminal ig-like domain-containing protein [Bacillota bacterium]
MLKHALLHLPYDPMAYPVGEDEVEVVLRAARGDLKSAGLLYVDRYGIGQHAKETGLRRVGSDSLFDYWSGRMKLRYGRFMYHFALSDGESEMFYGEGGLSAEPVAPEVCNPWAWCFHYPYTWRRHGADNPPAWAADSVVYQIFVDRFANGDETNDPSGVDPWGTRPTSRSFSGGDLAGIIDRLD